MRKAVWLILGAVLAALSACSEAPQPETVGPSTVDLTGTWRGVLQSPGGELPFVFEIGADGSGHIMNGSEAVPFSDVEVEGRQFELAFDWYDAELSGRVSEDGSVLSGRWRKTTSSGESTLPFRATRGVAVRFLPWTASPAPGAERLPEIQGDWAVTFEDQSSSDVAHGEFSQQGERVTGTFRTPTGDYRFLEGRYEQGVLRLSTFDGAHAFLFTASAQPDGSLAGDFWSRDTYHATWRGVRDEAAAEVLPDAWEQQEIAAEGPLRLAFENLQGETVSLDDPRFGGKPVLVNLFGSWCPNCADEAPLLAQWHREYGDELEFLGLAFEYTGDVERDRRMVSLYAERHGIEYPLLLAGTSDKVDAAQVLGITDRVVAYPTTLFLNRAHEVVAVHSGFSGPGTGEHYTALVAELEHAIESLIENDDVD